MNDKTYDGPCRLCGYSDDDPYIPTYLAPKTVLNDRYIVGRLLSYNGEGAVYIGYDTAAGVKVTVKEYMPDTLCSRRKGETAVAVNSKNSPLYKTYMSEFEDLHRTLMKLHGMTHIQAVMDVFFENNTCYAVCEFINGISLKTFLANSTGGLSWDQVKELFPPIFTTLSLAHQAGIIHRGISPQTIFVTDKMELKLAGFSISAARTTNTEIACEIFNGYAAPEQYTDDEMNGTWTDVYGISAVLYRVLTGTSPIESTSGAIVDMPEPMLVNRNVPPNVSKVIMRGMAHSPEHRTRSIGDLVSRLFAPPKYAPTESGTKARDGEAQKALSPKAQKRLEKQQRERRKTLAVLILAGVTLILFAIVFALAMSGKLTYTPSDEPALSGSSLPSSSTGNNNSAYVSETSSDTSLVESQPEISEPESTVSEIEDLIEVPDFTDRRYDRTTAQYDGIFTFVPTYDYSDSHAEGTMYDQSVEEGTMLKKGAQISVKVSKGSSAVTLPSYQGKKGSDYVDLLTSLNIKYSVSIIKSDTVQNGYVVRCNKEVGEVINVKDGENITVYIAG
ncbi:MAG: PASTA domain-containing protein [Oscillospiraceae bacterium]|nr:PASTA domain-containing protein [Oscillospiraceae bacterium]